MPWVRETVHWVKVVVRTAFYGGLILAAGLALLLAAFIILIPYIDTQHNWPMPNEATGVEEPHHFVELEFINRTGEMLEILNDHLRTEPNLIDYGTEEPLISRPEMSRQWRAYLRFWHPASSGTVELRYVALSTRTTHVRPLTFDHPSYRSCRFVVTILPDRVSVSECREQRDFRTPPRDRENQVLIQQ